MKSFTTAFLAAKIEYHWLIIKKAEKRLRKANKKDKIKKLQGLQNYHRFIAERESYVYEILAGLRDSKGVFIP